MAKAKLTVYTTLRGYSKKKGKGCFALKLGDTKLTDAQRKTIDDLIDGADAVRMSIEPIEGTLPGLE